MARTRRRKATGVWFRRWRWRWRSNPLHRRSDTVEAWVVLATWILALLGAVCAGVAAAMVVDGNLSARRAQVHAVSAELTENSVDAAPAAGGYDDSRVWATVRWKAADGSVHTDRAKVAPGIAAGSRVTMWTDGTGRLVSKPLDATESWLQAAVTGALVAPAVGFVVWGGGRLVCGQLLRRRLAEWDEEWKRIGPQWRNLSGGRG
ncbi:hypothetical protein AB0I54_28990 [Streptomyces sp. NPDC050625]|uniref:Rv1733c family protein n=1 Tax=Streptomyces sp. NPDC050625 TaxID=3154629 RepID=UPI003414BA17